MVLPVLLCGLELVSRSRRGAQDASIAAGVVRVQTGTILTQARELLVRLVDLTAKDCGEALPTMQRWATLNPYVRALILAQDDRRSTVRRRSARRTTASPSFTAGRAA